MISHPKRPVNEFDYDFPYFFAVGIYEQSLTSVYTYHSLVYGRILPFST